MISGNGYMSWKMGQAMKHGPLQQRARDKFEQVFGQDWSNFSCELCGETGETVPSFQTRDNFHARGSAAKPPLYHSTLVSRSCGPVLYDLVESLNACVWEADMPAL